MLRYYHYRSLSPRSQEAYKKLAAAVKNWQSSVDIDNITNFQAIIEAVKDDNPHFFYVDWYTIYYNISFTGHRVTIHLKYHMSKNTALAIYNKIKLMAHPLRGRDVCQTIKNAHDFLAKTVRYDTPVYEAGGFRLYDHNLIGPLTENLGVCEGIARAMQFLLRELRVDCTYVTGVITEGGKREYHAWNLVELNGKKLKIDVTWDLADCCGGRVSYDYYCIPA